MNSSRCSFTSIPDETLLGILSFCSVDDILKLETTCRTIHSKCQDKLLWTRLILKLDALDAPDCPFQHDLSNLSACELRRKVTGALRLSHNWNTVGHLKISQKVELSVELSDLEKYVKARLLPGGRELLVDNSDRLELWSLDSKERLWVSPHYEGRECIKFDFQVSEDKRMVDIADVFGDGSNRSILRVYVYNFKENVSTLAFEQTLEETFLICAMLRSDLLMTCIPMTSQVILMNWKTEEFAKVDFSDRQTSQGLLTHTVELIEGHLVSFNQGAQFSALAVPLSIVDGHWSKSRNPDHWDIVTVKADEWPILNIDAENIRETSDVPLIFGVHSFKPTWIKDAPTEIYVASFDRRGRKPGNRNIISYRLRLSTGEPSDQQSTTGPDQCLSSPDRRPKRNPLTLVSVSQVPVSYQPWNPDSFTNAGRMCILVRNTVRCFSLFPSTPSTSKIQPMNWLELDEDIGTTDEDVVMTVEPWSGAIAVGTPGRVRVFYL